MSGLFGVLTIGTSGLLLQQRAINVTGNNIANVNTPGYSRQRCGWWIHAGGAPMSRSTLGLNSRSARNSAARTRAACQRCHQPLSIDIASTPTSTKRSPARSQALRDSGMGRDQVVSMATFLARCWTA